MVQKFDITKYVAEQEKLGSDEKSIRKLLPKWWQNPRLKKNGGLKLTDEGFAYLTKHFKAHRVRFDNEITYTNQLILRLDNFIDCPWYISKKDVYVFNDKMAVQLVLFSGNIVRFSDAKAKSLKSSLTKD
jgi:hypothetical protein